MEIEKLNISILVPCNGRLPEKFNYLTMYKNKQVDYFGLEVYADTELLGLHELMVA